MADAPQTQLDLYPDPVGTARTQTAALVTIALVLVVAAVTYLGPVFKPLLIGIFLFFLAKSVATSLERWRVPPWLSYLGLLLAAVGVGAVILLVLSNQAAQLGVEMAKPIYQDGMKNVVNHYLKPTGYSLGDVEIPAADVFGYLFGQGLETLELLALAIFYLLFFIIGAGKFSRRLHLALPDEHSEPLFKIGEEISASLEEFIKIKTLVGVGMGITSGIILLLFGIKYWLLWSFLFFLLNYIHYIGSMAALIPPIAIAFINFDRPLIVGDEPYLQFNDPLRASLVSGLLVLNRFVWIDFIEIRLSGERLNIEPVLIFLWLTYWGWFWGVVGLILAYPMLASLRIILGHIDATKRWAFLMSEE